MEIIYADNYIVVCLKPCGVLSTDEPGGLPDLLRAELGTENIRTVHRLDRVVGGMMLLARTRHAASDLGKQIMEEGIGKEYLAVVEGCPAEEKGSMRDYLRRDKAEKKTYVSPVADENTQEALLDYEVLERRGEFSAVRIRLHTGRTHQIRAQFSSRGLPLVGDKKYGSGGKCNIALWSYGLDFHHPKFGERMSLSHMPPDEYPWNLFECFKQRLSE
ncbi:MAG: RNA pseudouridine synthase [Ruminococcaceae bacterium]|nr:RNA pseudouridine synthase [Oscillospiraceae bacterium]